jgi:hypothetical protein
MSLTLLPSARHGRQVGLAVRYQVRSLLVRALLVGVCANSPRLGARPGLKFISKRQARVSCLVILILEMVGYYPGETLRPQLLVSATCDGLISLPLSDSLPWKIWREIHLLSDNVMPRSIPLEGPLQIRCHLLELVAVFLAKMSYAL